ncbi:MAG: CsbD family protein [Janthinobacterium lividum]
MDSDRIEGAANTLGGKVKDAVGGVFGDSKTQAEGKADQVAGQLQNAYGSAKDTVRDATGNLGSQAESFVKQQPVLALFSAVGIGFVLSRLLSRR